METPLNKLQPGLMQMSGRIQERSFFDIFEEIFLKKVSGVLRITLSKKHEYRLYFREGLIVYSENSRVRTDELVLEMIKNSGLVTRDTIVKSEGKKSKIMKSLLEILIDEGHVSMLLYSKIISTTARMNIIEAAFVSKGAFSFENRNSVREVHGVRPVDFSGVAVLKNTDENKILSIRKILRSLYFNVTGNGTDHLIAQKSILQNYLTTEIDFIEFINRAADDLLSGKWNIQSRFMTAKVVDTAARYAFRTFIFTGLCTFLYLATMTATFTVRKEHRSVRDFYFFKISLLSSLYTFETGEPADINKLLMNSLVTKEDVEHSGIENRSEK